MSNKPIFKERRRQNHTPLKRVARGKPIPAAAIQEAIFLHNKAWPENVSLNIIYLFSIENCDDIELFKQVFVDVTRRYELMRTYFRLGEDRVEQIICPEDEAEVSLKHTDLSHLSADQQEIEMRKVTNDEGYRPFSLEELPLYRAHLFKLGPAKCGLFFAIHHSIFDMGTRMMFMKDIVNLYEARKAGGNRQLPEPEFQFADYCAWEAENLTEQALQKQIDYWKSVFNNAPMKINLPTDFSRPEQIGSNFKTVSGNLSTESWNLSKGIAERVSTFQANLALFSLFLGKKSGDLDLLIGSAISTRRSRGLPDLAGPMVLDFVLRCRIDENLTFLEYARQIAEQSILAYQNSEVDFDRLIKICGQKRDAGTYPLYQVDFFLRVAEPTEKSDGLIVKIEFLDSGSGEADLTCRLEEREKGATAIFRYNADLFRQATMEQMLEEYRELHLNVCKNPGTKIKEYLNLSSRDANKPRASYPKPPKASRFVPAQDSFEKLMTQTWCEVLKLSQVGRHDNFFDLGGDIRDLANVYRSLKKRGYDFEFKDLYRNATIAGLGELFARKFGDLRRKAG